MGGDCFRVQNSWGESFGGGDFFWMPFEWLRMVSPQKDRVQLKFVSAPPVLIDSADVQSAETRTVTSDVYNGPL